MRVSIILILISLALAQLLHDAIPLKIVTDKRPVVVKTLSVKQHLVISFPEVDYQLSARVFESSSAKLSDQLHNATLYDRSSSCEMYPTSVSLNLIERLEFTQQIESSIYIQEASKLFIILSRPKTGDSSDDSAQKSERDIHEYDLTRSGFIHGKLAHALKDFQLDISVMGKIMMAKVGKYLFLTDGINLSSYDYSRSQITIMGTQDGSPLFAGTAVKENLLERFQQIGSASNGNIRFQTVWSTKILIFEFVDMYTFAKVRELSPDLGNVFYDGIYDGKHYWSLEDSTLKMHNINDSTSPISYSLESKVCQKIVKIEEVIHLICTESDLSYVAEIIFNELNSTLTLNRYYNYLDDVKDVFTIGTTSNKIIIHGDQSIIITSNAVNLRALLDLKKSQPKVSFRSFGLEELYEVRQYSTNLSTFGVGVGNSFLILMKFDQEPPELDCYFEEAAKFSRKNILIAINTTNCAGVNSIQSVCQVLIPYVFYLSSYEITSQGSTYASTLAIVIAVSIIFFLLGFFIKHRALREKAVRALMQKLNKLRKKDLQMKPI